MTKEVLVGARITTEDCRKLDRLARRAGLNRSEVLRALVRAADFIAPPDLATAHFGDSSGAAVSQGHGAAVA